MLWGNFTIGRRSLQGQRLLKEIERLQQQHIALFHAQLSQPALDPTQAQETYEIQRGAITDRMTATLNSYIGLHQARISLSVNESRASSVQAEAVTQQLVLVALLFGSALRP